MSLLSLAARICNQFSSATSSLRMVQKVKDGQSRDVVTSLDSSLHHLTADFLISNMPNCRLISEEGDDVFNFNDLESLSQGEWLIVDPLDGSNNYALTLPGFGFMATHLLEGKIVGSIVILPEYDIYILFENNMVVTSQAIQMAPVISSGSTYYAYPPQVGEGARHSRAKLIDLMDHRTSGLYRYGSACVGLYNLIRGAHRAFIGHGIRLWDAIAYFPLLCHYNIFVRYHINPSGIVLVASKDIIFVNEACDIISANESLEFTSLFRNSSLVFSV